MMMKDTGMPSPAHSFKHNVWQLIFIPAISISILLSVSLVSFCLYELSKFVDMRGTAMTRKTAQLIYTPIIERQKDLVQALLDGSLEDPYIRALDVHITTTGETFHSGPEFFSIEKPLPTTDYRAPSRRETRRSILYSHPITDKTGSNTIGWVEMEMMSSPYLVIHYETILITLAITLICLLMAAYLAICLYRAITKPLNHIQQVVQLLANGDLHKRVDPQANREFTELANTINSMAISLESAQQDLQNHINQSTQDLTETLETIEIKNIELDIARKEAIEGSRIKSEFLANTSHEIRTPLNGILGFVNLALKADMSEQQKEYLHTIRDSARNLLTVINGVLDFSKLEAGKLTLEYAPLSLRQTLDETLQILATNAHEKNLQLISYVDSKIPSNLLGDSLRLKQVVSNLIHNAIKFSTQGSITLRAYPVSIHETHLIIRISISDQGKGLSKAEQDNVFKPFTQTDASASREQGGTGLGLAICKGLVERMKGEIGVESEPDKGSTFWFTARLGIEKIQSSKLLLPNLNDRRILLCGANNDSLKHIQSLLKEWKIPQETIHEIHEIFPIIRKSQYQKAFELLILDVAPSDRNIQPMLLNNISEQLLEEFNCKVITCCTAAHQRLFRVDNKNSLVTFIHKPINYDSFLNMLCENLNIVLSIDKDESNAKKIENNYPLTKVLLVDDNLANLQLASELLRALNAQVVQASNGPDAIEICKNNPFDIIFMDIQMPGMDGFEATKRIRNLEKGSHRTPIIALTAHSVTEQKSKLLIAGMDDCISKPVSEVQLAHLINRWATSPEKHPVVESDSKLSNPLPLNITDSDLMNSVTPPVNQESSSRHTTLHNQDTEIKKSVDLALCLKLANHKPALARDMLKMMLESLPLEKAEIQQAAADKDLTRLNDLVHRLYGSSCYCGVPQLKEVSGRLDKSLHSGKDLDIQAALTTLNMAIDDILEWGQGRNLNEFFSLSPAIQK
jgi:two-component system, NarL family, sensor histidine kinase BarA